MTTKEEIEKAKKTEKATLAEIQKVVNTMLSPEWSLALDKESDDTKTEADIALEGAQKRKLLLENAQLEDIAKKLIENEKRLKAGKKS
jgi:hypothetical protein